MSEALDNLKTAALKCTSCNDPMAKHVAQKIYNVVLPLIDGTIETPVQTVIQQCSLDDVKKMQAIGVTGREETRVKKITAVVFSLENTDATTKMELGKLIENSITTCMEALFFESYMTEQGGIQWSRFFTYLNKRVEELLNEEKLAAIDAANAAHMDM